MVESRAVQQIGYILRSYPRLSQTFILNEILALEQAGVSLRIFALADPHENVIQDQTRQVKAQVEYLTGGSQADLLHWHRQVARRHPVGYRRALLYTLRSREIDRGYSTQNRVMGFSRAVQLVHLLDSEQSSTSRTDHIHAHFAHDPTLIAQLTGIISQIPFSFTAHARDLYQVPRQILAERIRQARNVVTCCQANLDYLHQVEPRDAAKVALIHHGVDLERFHPDSSRNRQERPFILSVGRLVEKKGFSDLIETLGGVRDQGIDFDCEIYGDGPLESLLQKQIQRLQLGDRVRLMGSRTQAELVSVYRRADLFVLTPYVTEDGDRDGIPNVLVEAMAAGVPVLSVSTSGIPELVTSGENGILVSPHDIADMVQGIVRLLADEALRLRLGVSARRRVMEAFDQGKATIQLMDVFGIGTPEARTPASLSEPLLI